MTTNFLYAQSPNRKGNQSKNVPGMGGIKGATAVTGPKHGVATPKGNQGAAKATGNITGRHQPVSVSTTKSYDRTPCNDAYMNSDRNNFLK
jgi:hypothetical protein